MVVHVTEFIESLLLALEVVLRRPCCFSLQRAVHALVRAVLLWMAWHDALDADAEPDPPTATAHAHPVRRAEVWQRHVGEFFLIRSPRGVDPRPVR